MAIAREQEMKALAQEARAKVIEAECKLPEAMAQAFLNGNLGIMDYYKMKNIEADTTMRQHLGNSPLATPEITEYATPDIDTELLRPRQVYDF